MVLFRRHHLFITPAFFALAAPALAFTTVWQLGTDDGSLAPFSQESFGPNSTPGSATTKDDDYYLAGTYPAPIGTLGADEPIANFERAVTSGDPRNRIHFHLSAAQASADSLLRVTVDLTNGGAWINGSIPGFSHHDITVRLNGNVVASESAVRWNKTLVFTFPASSAQAMAGQNTLLIERSGGAPGGYIGFDFIRFEARADALADSDNDAMPRWFEETFNLDDLNPADASLDPDGDELDNLAEFLAGTNPTDPDSDNDGISDADEAALGTNPLLSDTDGDGLPDSEEERLGTNPSLPDTDADGIPDNIEVAQGSDPLDENSAPFDFPGAISLQFLCENNASAALPAHELAGFLPMAHWNSSPPLPHWVGSNVVLQSALAGLKNHRGTPTTASASWSYHHAGDGLHKGPGDARLLSGMIRTRRDASINTPVTINLSGIPYPIYDIIVYPGYIYPHDSGTSRRGAVSIASAPSSTRFFSADSAPPFTGWREITSTSPSSPDAGNFVRFRNLSGNSQSITLESLDFSTVAIHGLQIIDSATDSDGDGMSDAVELENGFNPLVQDASADADGDDLANSVEISIGTDPHHPDTDRDGIPDGDEAGHGTSPLVPDSDSDGLLDGDELLASPFSSDPTLADTDGDGFSDFVERSHGSDPRSTASTPPPVPVWDPATRTWLWRIDNLRIVWNHHQSMLGAIPGNETLLFEAVADIQQSGWSRQIAIGIRYLNGRLVHRFRGVEGAFHAASNPESGFWDSDWNANPADRRAALGFSGFGTFDDSHPLRLQFTATRPDPNLNLWTIQFLIADLRNPTQPVTIATYTRTDAAAAHPSLLTGNSIWTNSNGQPGHIDIQTETGVRALLTTTAPGTPDADNDGMPDAWETLHSFQPSNPSDAALDADNDGLSNIREFLAGTNPHLADTDGDGVPDGVEILHGSDPLAAASSPAWFGFSGTIDDLDGDGLSDAWVLWSGGKNRLPDRDDDGDGLTNRQESLAGTDPDDPTSRFDLRSWIEDDNMVLSWTHLPHKSHHIRRSPNLKDWETITNLPQPVVQGGRAQVVLTDEADSSRPTAFYQAGATAKDTDGDGVEDWIEEQVLGSSPTASASLGQPLSSAGVATLSGDAIALLNRMQGSSASGGPPGGTNAGSPSPLHAARFLMQATFGPVPEAIEEVRNLGYSAWIDHQVSLPPSLTRPYIREIKRDGAGPRTDPTYNFNELDQFVHGNNITTPIARNAIGGEDQLRQRVAFALSQILVVSRRDANLEEKPEAMASYYDLLTRHALGNYGELLREVTLHPAMGWYLSHAGNQKADPSIPRYPDENYAREIMQLFTIGLWELNPDGSRKLDSQGEPIPTYDNGDVTELARAFTGLYFTAPYGWGGGGWADEHFTQPMVMYPDRHDFGAKRLPNGVILPPREPSEAHAMRDIDDAVHALFLHPNTPPFVSRQLIQFLITDNPSPSFVRRVQDVFVNDGNGVRGNLAAVIKAILLDPEARELPLSPTFGKVREPVVRAMHLGRLFRLAETHPRFVWWNWTENFYAAGLQEPLNSPSVFNFYTPFYQAPGAIRNSGLVSPGFQIVNTFSGIAFPNLIWDYLHRGFRSAWSWRYPLDYSHTLMLAENPAALLDHVDLLVCAGNMTSRTRSILTSAISNPGLAPKERVALAVWLAFNSPEGAIQR